MTYKTSLDNLAKGITISITILFALIIVGQFSIISAAGLLMPISTIVVLAVSYFLTIAFRPINYSLTTDKLIIHRLFRNIIIERKDIKSIEQIDKEKIKGTLRNFGVGGLFGYFGKFTNRDLGRMTWYATRRDNIVLVQTIGNKKIILTPNEPQKFVADFNLQ
jgi:Bacterial PH domain